MKKVIILLWQPVVTPVTTVLSEDYAALSAASLVVSAPTDRQSHLRYWLLFRQLSFSHLSSVIWERERERDRMDQVIDDVLTRRWSIMQAAMVGGGGIIHHYPETCLLEEAWLSPSAPLRWNCNLKGLPYRTIILNRSSFGLCKLNDWQKSWKNGELNCFNLNLRIWYKLMEIVRNFPITYGGQL